MPYGSARLLNWRFQSFLTFRMDEVELNMTSEFDATVCAGRLVSVDADANNVEQCLAWRFLLYALFVRLSRPNASQRLRHRKS